MLYPKTRWIVQNTNGQNAKELAEQLHIAQLLASLLINRGINDVNEAKSFLYTDTTEFHDPFLFADMEKSVKRIKYAIETNEPILIFGDYDADGVTSTSVMMDVLTKLNANVTYYIPNRFTEGYGPNENAFREASDRGIKLIITVDTGISAINEIKIANELGMDVIITDHHEPGNILPDAYTIIHPKLPHSQYPFSELAGVGVAFKLAHAINGALPEELLDLVAIGTIADLVPLHGENRLLVKAGLKRLTHTSRLGLQALCEISGTKLLEINEETVGFAIGPRLNAAGRMNHAGPAVELLRTTSVEMAKQLAEEIDIMNKERQQYVTEITNEAVEMVESDFPPDENNVIVVGKEGWSAGVIGIVASRLVDRFYRPAIVLSYDHTTGLAKGSARSILGFDLYKNLSSLSHLLPHFGGHPMAAGMTLNIEDVDLLRQKLNEACGNQLTVEDFIPVTELDASLKIDEINVDTIGQLGMLAPYGMGNPKPIVMIKDTFAYDVRKIGANKNHLKMTLEKDGTKLDGVGFNIGYLADEVSTDARVSVIGELSINEWNNMRKPQIMMKDLAINEWQLFDIRGHKQIDLADPMKIIIIFSEENINKLNGNQNYVLVRNKEAASKVEINRKQILLFDLPKELDILDSLIRDKSPDRIYTHFYNEESQFFSILPTRDHFKWYYAFLLKRQTFDVNKFGHDLANHRGWSIESVKFMSQVFFELNFVTIKDGLIHINPDKQKKDLADSSTYRNKLEQIKMEKLLLFSSFNELKAWFDERLAHKVSNEEEANAWI
ncbi:single-stranded-DNA-specific exonuclease RecJ [Lederbergia wuyishanensis]|uniref:Single-stranded-DNA-specific exonuclease RecJ n=1 Tax=Lederbergia wuyishanensis TaxID=1347903 RepID=A0ABU0D1Q6_9BACI|nr:single-stranded-DNA-specific exonuclease RecJ [Lederbergia wuyishanensis]MCJ8006941.1 single-stranded-DNA-specific exonuclease RecJ [Lederbergia wuyishanensis]MDQ0342325.1 single-stranded-DNA-specific exonuclease [Lederbergia wuyishanensis]